MIHAEKVLIGYRCTRSVLVFNLNAFLCFKCLVQAVRIAAAVENTARLLVDDLHLVVHHHILDVLFEHGEGFQQLDHRVPV